MRKLYLALAAAGALLLAALGLARCHDPGPPAPATSPTPVATAIAASSAQATASQAVKVTIRRPVVGPHAPQTLAENLHNEPETQSGSGGPHAQSKPAFTADPLSKDLAQDLHSGYEEIVIEVSQTATAEASSEASASASVDHFRGVTKMTPQHARLGVIAATMPGILAADYQLARIDVPPWLLGTPLELGLDAAANLEVGALGLTAGSKAFAGAWGWSRWNLSEQGLALGVGMRF